MRIPRGFIRLKLKKKDILISTGRSGTTGRADSGAVLLDKPAALPEGMVHVPGGSFELDLSGLERVDAIELGEYLIEVPGDKQRVQKVHRSQEATRKGSTGSSHS